MSEVCSKSSRTRGSTTVNDVGPGVRSYRGGVDEFTALITVVREIPKRSAIRDFGTPSAASLLISAQSSKVITLQSLSVHLSPPKLSSFERRRHYRAAREVETGDVAWCYRTHDAARSDAWRVGGIAVLAASTLR